MSDRPMIGVMPSAMSDTPTTTISHSWQTLDQAAVTLNVSARTIARRLKAGQIESRVDDRGRRVVLVQLVTDKPAPVSDRQDVTDARQTADDGQPSDALSVSDSRGTMSDNAVSQQLVAVALQDLQQTVSLARDDARRARRGARLAWSLVALAGAGVVVVVGWISSTLTRTAVVNDTLGQQVGRISQERDQLRQQLDVARDDAAQARGQLAGVLQAQQQATQTTKAAAVVDAPATQPTQTFPVVPKSIASMLDAAGW